MTFPFRSKRYDNSVFDLQMVRKWLRVDVPGFDDEDSVLADLIEEACSHIETECNLSLTVCEYTWNTNCFPCDFGDIRYIKELVSIKYQDEQGAYVDVSTTDYQLIRTGPAGSKIFYKNKPQVYGRPLMVEIKFKAGFGDDELPEKLAGAARAYIAERYDNRGDSVAERRTLSDKLMQPFKQGYVG